jgi:hypothetical protein
VRASHNVEIIEIATGSGRDDVIALGDEDQVPILDSNGFIKSLVVVHPLEGEAIGRLHVMVIGLLQVGLMRRVLRIVFVWREGGPVASRSDDLDHD